MKSLEMQKCKNTQKIKSILLILFYIPLGMAAQICFDFEEQDLGLWVQYPANCWDTSSRDALDGNFSLHHVLDNQGSGKDRISVPIFTLDATAGLMQWHFYLRHAYPPSSANNWSIFLMASQPAFEMRPKGNIQAFVLGVNFVGSDDRLKLWYLDHGKVEEILDTRLNWEEEFGQECIQIRVCRYPVGRWCIEAGLCRQEDNLLLLGSAYHPEIIMWPYLGFYYKYSSKQDRKLWIDALRIDGIIHLDSIPPSIENIELYRKNILRLQWDEVLCSDALQDPGNYLLDGILQPDSVSFDSEYSLELFFPAVIDPDKLHLLLIREVSDKLGNSRHMLEHSFRVYWPARYDVILSEVMADPVPYVGLPEEEYIALYNRSDTCIDLSDWQLVCARDTSLIPSCILQGGKEMILTRRGACVLFDTSISCLELWQGNYYLRNQGSLLMLLDPGGAMVHGVEYDVSWHHPKHKSQGGWSLEIIDADNVCEEMENWSSCIHRNGGTPGQVNSIRQYNPDRSGPEVLFTAWIDSIHYRLHFSEPLDMDYKGDPVLKGRTSLLSWNLTEPLDKCMELELESTPEIQSILNGYFDAPPMDCSGNFLLENAFKIGSPREVQKGDVLINEIMFNSCTGGTEYIEILNRSQGTFDLSNLMVGWENPDGSGEPRLMIITEIHRLFFPGEYLVLTPDEDALLEQFPNTARKNILSPEGMYALSDREGRLFLCDRSLRRIDKIHYNENMHHPLLDEVDGISLERMYHPASSNPGNQWHSASSSVGFGTPAAVNSQKYKDVREGNGSIELSGDIFSPDNDGYRDYLFIYLDALVHGTLVNTWIFDSMGRPVVILAAKHLTGDQNVLVWDGRDAEGQPCSIGPYILLVEIIEPGGRIKNERYPVIVSGVIH